MKEREYWIESTESVDSDSKNVVILRTTKAFKKACWKALLTNWKNHPRFDVFLYWVNRNGMNQTWYQENIDKLRLVDDWIDILWDVFCLEDEVANSNGIDVFDNCWNVHFTYKAALNHAKAKGKEIPSDWFKYLNFLPWNDTNKVRFLTDVMWIKRAGYRVLANKNYSCHGVDSFYWSNDDGWTLACSNSYIATEILPAKMSLKPVALSLRCLKTR